MQFVALSCIPFTARTKCGLLHYAVFPTHFSVTVRFCSKDNVLCYYSVKDCECVEMFRLNCNLKIILISKQEIVLKIHRHVKLKIFSVTVVVLKVV